MPRFDQYVVRYASANMVGNVRCMGGDIDIGNTLTEGGHMLHTLWDPVTASEAVSGKTEYRCFYVKNLHPTKALLNPILIVQSDTEAAGDTIAVGWGSALIGGIEQTIATESTAPIDVAFTSSNQLRNGAILGRDIPPLSHKAVWVRRIVTNDAQAKVFNKYIIRLLADNIRDTVYNEPLNLPPAPPFTNVLGVGETDVTTDTTDVINAVRHRDGNLLITCGNHMQGDFDGWWWTRLLGDKLVASTRICFGHNDRLTRSCENWYMSRWRLRHRHHSHRLFHAYFLHLDTSGISTDWDTSSEHFEFVQKELQAANADPKVEWIIVVMNRAIYASPTSTNTNKILSASLRDTYHQLFVDNNVHMVLQGYFRNYQRMNCLGYNAGTPDQPIVVHAGDDPDYLIPAGQKGFGDGNIFLVCGMGGSGHDNISSAASYMIYGNTTDHGYLSLWFDNANRKLSTTFYDKHHNIKDTFSIQHL